MSQDKARGFRHDHARRPNNPPAGVALTYEMRECRTTRYEYDSHLDPQLVWTGKAEHTSYEVDVVSLRVHECIPTHAFLDTARRPQPPQFTLFGGTLLLPDKVGWTNRPYGFSRRAVGLWPSIRRLARKSARGSAALERCAVAIDPYESSRRHDHARRNSKQVSRPSPRTV